MLLTRLCNTALDRVRQNRNAAIEQVLAFGGSDLVCYRADMPAELVRRQAEAWDPLLDWLTGRHGIELRTGAEIAFIQQSSNALAGLKEVISTLDDFHLAGLHAATTLMGSLVIALALMECRLDVEQAFGAALVDDIYQEERWGRDEEMSAKTAAKKRELSEISRFIELLAQ